jgi:hypothetical protein
LAFPSIFCEDYGGSSFCDQARNCGQLYQKAVDLANECLRADQTLKYFEAGSAGTTAILTGVSASVSQKNGAAGAHWGIAALATGVLTTTLIILDAHANCETVFYDQLAAAHDRLALLTNAAHLLTCAEELGQADKSSKAPDQGPPSAPVSSARSENCLADPDGGVRKMQTPMELRDRVNANLVACTSPRITHFGPFDTSPLGR